MGEVKASPFATLHDVIEANATIGHHFFSRGARDFFHSRVESDLIRGRYFIPSEQCEDGTRFDTHGEPIPASERRFTVRWVEDNGSITTLSDHMAFGSTAEAMEFILKHDNPA